jgi:hypothetical protein
MRFYNELGKPAASSSDSQASSAVDEWGRDVFLARKA